MSRVTFCLAMFLTMSCTDKGTSPEDTSPSGCDTATGVGCDCDWDDEPCPATDIGEYACDPCGNVYGCYAGSLNPATDEDTWTQVGWPCWCVQDDGTLMDHPDCQYEE